MMKKSLWTVLMSVGLAGFLGFVPLQAQENVGDDDKFSFGSVVSVGEGQITLKEYDFAKDADVETVYYLSSETELGNINGVGELVVGDDVVLDYSDQNDRRVITTLVKEEKGAEMPEIEAEVILDEEPLEEAEPTVEAEPLVEVEPLVEAEVPVAVEE